MFGKHPGHHIPSPESEIPEIPNPALETQHVTLERVKTSSQSDSAQISSSLSFLENKNTRWQIGDDHYSSAAPRLETKRCHFSAFYFFFSTNVLVQWKGSRRDLNPVRVKSKSGHIGKTFCLSMFFSKKFWSQEICVKVPISSFVQRKTDSIWSQRKIGLFAAFLIAVQSFFRKFMPNDETTRWKKERRWPLWI